MPRKKIPTKAELIQLQKLYKTDEKIAERLGVTAQLVAYWRRKKNIPRHSFPKFSKEEIKDLWERYGDDYRCGLDLGISKAAFYNWRRKYNIREKPAFLKLEQLELDLGGPEKVIGKKLNNDHQTVVQKLMAEIAEKEKVEVGEKVCVEPDLMVLFENSTSVVKKFLDSGREYVWNPNRIAIALDHAISNGDAAKTADMHRMVRDFAKRQKIKHFIDISQGAGHQAIIENGLILPGYFSVSNNTGVTSYGALDSYGITMCPDRILTAWIDGKLEIEIPPTIAVNINGKPPDGIYAKDIILFLARKLPSEKIKGRVIEFHGTTISQMPISSRVTLCNMVGEMGGISAICPFDSITRRYFLRRTKMPYRPSLPDKNAVYEESYEINIDQITPQIARPHNVANVEPVSDVAGLPVNQVIIGSCGNGHFDDLRIAADVLKGNQVHKDLRLFIMPGSRQVYLEALKKGLIRAFIESGAVVLNPGCISCSGSSQTLLASGERCLATINSNSRGLMGSPESEIYIVSPATAAVSALKGVITDPTGAV